MTDDPDAKPFILAVDPGLANGVCLVERASLKKLYSDELDWRHLTRYAAEVMLEHGSNLDVTVEKFTITIHTAKNAPGATGTIEVIGMMRLMAAQYNVGDLSPLQTPGDAQDFCDGKRLRDLGWWHRGGAGHANMALRHAALRLLRTGCRDRVLLGLDQ